jgi:hypothetical protein
MIGYGDEHIPCRRIPSRPIQSRLLVTSTEIIKVVPLRLEVKPSAEHISCRVAEREVQQSNHHIQTTNIVLKVIDTGRIRLANNHKQHSVPVHAIFADFIT